MDADELKRDRETCERATPGPWQAPSEEVADQIGLQIRAVYYPEGDTRRNTTFVCEVHKQSKRPDVGHFNSAFIAAARTRWPLALDEIDRLRDALAACEREMDGLSFALRQPCSDDGTDCTAVAFMERDRDAAIAEAGRLRGALDAAASSLETLSHAGLRDPEKLLSHPTQVRGYAHSRGVVARAALSTPTHAAPSAEPSEDDLIVAVQRAVCDDYGRSVLSPAEARAAAVAVLKARKP